MGFNIVTVNVSQTIGAIPADLQQRSAVLSFGSSLQEPGKPVLITRDKEISELVKNAIGSLIAAPVAKSSGSVNVTMTLPEGVTIGRDNASEVKITVSGCSPDQWNGSFTATVTDNSTLTWTIADSQLTGSPVTLGQFSIDGSENLVTAVNTFFAQGNSVGTYLLELGVQKSGVSAEIAALKTWMEDPLKRFYAYLVPQAWDGNTDFITLAKLYTANEAKQYFFVLTKTPPDTSYVSPYAGIKSIVATADDTYPATNAAASALWNFVSASPSEINKVPPMAFRYLQAVNAHKGKNSILTTMTKQKINYVDTGAEGGISNTILVKGVTSDGNDMTYWYSVDWVQINVDMQLANTVINGSNNPINPLYYNQDGVDRLQQVAQGVFNTGVSYGLVNGKPVVNAVPFRQYIKTNPNDYGIGRYAGLSASYTPMRGFVEIIFNINVTMQLS
ncbi:hypothetical protein EHB58_09475 [Salmonella enterica subsp. enterica serovar Hull]|uniref:DUF3383 domain-containing protein n=1 Tax=Salmonella enterica subsp. enterica serovar Hull TaxID=1403564 RepID=A0A5X4PE39_SALET|nr:hypothetical protein [Citrobacter sedlakii]EBZ7585855.1 hypothetical protein [Salmonella enterica subsp. enterica serovar Hull]EIV7027916.1 hypothetical protein [Salmonella enterica]EBZ8648442.1 hypothetical protein [Salmonella enterica subsp. enterica serovar Hull]EIW3704012.1 hypothetical protein [Salmonella enterica]MCZ4675990.1 hypothetical protein [Citrobacter sedlakii]